MDTQTHQSQTILQAVSTFLSYYDKEAYEGVFIFVRQRDGLFESFSGGNADDPHYADDWAAVQYYAQALF